ncbi:MAG: hypothetical protein ACRD0K_04480 [Egibacteraceae bacterium]
MTSRVLPKAVRRPAGATSLPRPAAIAFVRVALPVTRWAPLERASGLLFMALVATLTLEWISLGGFLSGNIKPYHLAAVAFIAVSLMRYRPSRRLALILERRRAFYGAWIFYLLLVAVIGLTRAEPYFGRTEVVRQAFYGVTSVFVAAFFLDVDGGNVRRVLQWTGVASVVAVVVGLGSAVLRQGVNPLRLIGEALAKGDPDILSHQVFRLAFRSSVLPDASASLRHKVFSAVLIGLAVTLICRERPHSARSRWRNWLLLVSVAFGALLVVGSLSRAIILCPVIVLGLCGLRMLVQNRVSPRQLAAVLAIPLVVLVMVASPLGSLLWSRFTSDTDSYQARLAAVQVDFVQGDVPSAVEVAVLGAAASAVERPPHNVVLDAWLSAGVLGAAATALFLLAYLRVWLREVRRYLAGGPGWTLSLRQLWVVAVGVIPLVRAVTAGNGFHMLDWVCIGIVFGLVEANRRAAATRWRWVGHP